MLALSGGPECIYDSYEVGGAGYCSQTFPVGAAFASVVAGLLALAFAVWNYGYRQGTTGSSIGKSVMNFKVVSERTGQPTGFAMSLVRQLAHLLDAFLLHRLSVPVVGPQAADFGRQDHVHGLPADTGLKRRRGCA